MQGEDQNNFVERGGVERKPCTAWCLNDRKVRHIVPRNAATCLFDSFTVWVRSDKASVQKADCKGTGTRSTPWAEIEKRSFALGAMDAKSGPCQEVSRTITTKKLS
jgi:hypothetical protein